MWFTVLSRLVPETNSSTRIPLNGSYRSGTPYNITTGFDDNRDACN